MIKSLKGVVLIKLKTPTLGLCRWGGGHFLAKGYMSPSVMLNKYRSSKVTKQKLFCLDQTEPAVMKPIGLWSAVPAGRTDIRFSEVESPAA